MTPPAPKKCKKKEEIERLVFFIPSDIVISPAYVTQYPIQIFPSRASTSTFSSLYTASFCYDDTEDDSSAASIESIEPIELIESARLDRWDPLLDHFRDEILETQYLLADQPEMRDIIFRSIHDSESSRHALFFLAAVHRYCLPQEVRMLLEQQLMQRTETGQQLSSWPVTARPKVYRVSTMSYL